MLADDSQWNLVRRLSDGGVHSGEILAQELGVSRAAVWKRLKGLEEALGLRVDSIKGKGYCLRSGIEILDIPSIRGRLGDSARRRLGALKIHASIDSTNTWLMEEAARGALSGSVCLAERQTGGRGRHGREWVSPFGSNIYLSVLWRFSMAPGQLGGLSLACGVAVAQVLEDLGVEGIALKWPNDVLWQRRKLAGLLLEVRGEATGPCHVVAGVGLNTRLAPESAQSIEQPWVDLATVPGLGSWSRNQIAADLIDRLLTVMDEYARTGLAPFVQRWRRFDLFSGEQVELALGSRRISGRYLGIDEDGSIRLSTEGAEVCFNAGEVTLCRAKR